jgi:pre-rRNA-processing protein TSR2
MVFNILSLEVTALPTSTSHHPTNAPRKITAQPEAAIVLTLSLWPALALAVQNQWGGPLSTEKRDWFAGAISTLLDETPPSVMDVDYLKEFILQVMLDEFEVCVEDGSVEEVALGI